MEEVIIVLLSVIGLAAHFAKKLWDIKKATGQTISIKEYWLGNPYQSAFSVLMCMAGLLMLWGSAELTRTTAFMIGYVADSVSSAIKQRNLNL